MASINNKIVEATKMLNMNTSTSFKNEKLEENPGTILNVNNDSTSEKKNSESHLSCDGNERIKLRRLIKETKLAQQLNEEEGKLEHLKVFSQDFTNLVKSQINNYYILQLTIDASIKVYTMLGLICETSFFDRSLYFHNLEIIQQQIDLPAQQRKLKLDQLKNLEYNDLVDLFNAGFKDLDDKGEDSLLNAINAQAPISNQS